MSIQSNLTGAVKHSLDLRSTRIRNGEIDEHGRLIGEEDGASVPE